MSRKVIGLTGPSSFTQECTEAIEELLDANYVQLYQAREDNVKQWLDMVDGVILAGGIDIHPTIYNESIWTNCNMSKFDIKRDFRELAIIQYCLKTGKPMLGICRGHQLIGIKHGLGFLMDITNSPICHQPNKANITVNRNEPCHAVKFLTDECRDKFYQDYRMPEIPPERKMLHDVLRSESGKERKIWVNSFHHQAIPYKEKIKYAERKVEVLGIARVDLGDLCKEIIELMQGDNWISTQWHPEYDFRENTVSRVVLEKFGRMMDEYAAKK